MSTVHLLGDGILDNFTYLDIKSLDLEGRLIDLGYTVNNVASDNVKVADVIKGIKPVNTDRKYPYKVDKSGKINPLSDVIESIGEPKINSYGSQSKDHKDHIVVVSMGGNDLNSNLLSGFISLLVGPDHLVGKILNKSFKENYGDVLDKLKSATNKVILCNNYLPYMGKTSKFAQFSNLATGVMKQWNEYIRRMAEKNDIALLDLHAIFDSTDESHYTKEHKYPSNKMVTKMTTCIDHISKNYTGYKVYSISDNGKVESN